MKTTPAHLLCPSLILDGPVVGTPNPFPPDSIGRMFPHGSERFKKGCAILLAGALKIAFIMFLLHNVYYRIYNNTKIINQKVKVTIALNPAIRQYLLLNYYFAFLLNTHALSFPPLYIYLYR